MMFSSELLTNSSSPYATFARGLGQQSGRGDALINDLWGTRRLRQGFATATDPLAAHMALYCEQAGRVVQLLGNIFADALELAAASAGGGVWLVTVSYVSGSHACVGAAAN